MNCSYTAYLLQESWWPSQRKPVDGSYRQCDPPSLALKIQRADFSTTSSALLVQYPGPVEETIRPA